MWWDMLCVLNLPEGSGQCFTPEEKAKDDERRNKKSAAPPPPSALAPEESSDDRNEAKRLDAVFISKVLSATMLGEEWVRSMFRDFTTQVMNQVRSLLCCRFVAAAAGVLWL